MENLERHAIPGTKHRMKPVSVTDD